MSTHAVTTPHVVVAPRTNLAEVAPDAFRAVLDVERYLRANIDPGLLHLVKLRASILNGCAYCVDMHTTDALADGDKQRRLFAVAAWHESSFFTAAERAAFALTDAVTELGHDGVSDDVWNDAVEAFGEKLVADLVVAIGTINLWNRIAVTTRAAAPPLAETPTS